METWLVNNPHRLDLGQIGLALHHGGPEGVPAQIEDLSATEQTLDLWQGLLESRFRFDGEPVHVLTAWQLWLTRAWQAWRASHRPAGREWRH